jgi:tetratricopeptide (TPR) repeat protein
MSRRNASKASSRSVSFGSATASRPLVLLLDDLHWADEDSLALLAHLLGPSGTHGMLVLATAWPVAGDEQPPLARFLRRHPFGKQRLTQLWLGPLAAHEGARVVQSVIGTCPAGSVLAALEREAGGNPFLLVELARLVTEARLSVPSVTELARRRLALVARDESRLIELAAVAPGPIDADLLRAALDADSRPLALENGGLRRLCGLKILREAGSGLRSRERYDFYHHKIREAIRAQISKERQRKLHLRLADTLAALRPDDPESLVRELRLGGDHARAAQHAERAAEAAMAKLAHGRAVELYVLALGRARGADALRLRIRLGEALEGMARFTEAADQYRAALAASPDGLTRTRVETQLANCLMYGGDLERSGGLVEKVLADLGHRPSRPWPWRALVVLWLLLRVVVDRWRKPRACDDPEQTVRLAAYGMAVPHFQLTSRNLQQVEFALRFRLLGAGSPSAEVRQEAEAMSLLLLLPAAHLGGLIGRRVAAHFARLEMGTRLVARERTRAWLPLLRALYALVGGRPDRAIKYFDTLSGLSFLDSGYLALQRHNALFLAGEHDRFAREVGSSPRPLDVVRLAYIEHVRGRHETAARLVDSLREGPDDVPWTHRSMFTYQLVELQLLDGEMTEAARLARTLLPRIRPLALSPNTGAFESVDAVIRAFVAEARHQLEGASALGSSAPLVAGRCGERARQLIGEAAEAMSRAPLLVPPLFAARLLHDRAILALARGKGAEAMRLFHKAELRSRDGAVPCFRLRLIEDLLQLLREGDPQREALDREANSICHEYLLERRATPSPWLFSLV